MIRNYLKNFIKVIIFDDYRCNFCVNKYYKIQSDKTFNLLLKKLIKRRLSKKKFIILGKNSIAGNNIILPHPMNIVIGEDVIIGSDCIIYQGVTIGQSKGRYPKIGNNVIIYPGAKIIGDIVIGDNSIVGANAVVTKNVPSNTIVAGIPAKVLKLRTDDYEFC